MRPRLVKLLREASVVKVGEELHWDRILMINSLGRISSRDVESDIFWNRGFHLLLLSPVGEPEYYCKCRALHPRGVPHRESLILQFFNAHPSTRRAVPVTRVVADAGIEVQVSEFLVGVRVDRLIPTMSVEQREILADAVLVAAHGLSCTTLQFPELFERAGTPVVLVEESKKSLKLLSTLGVSSQDLECVESALREAGPITGIPQHRDLWPANVLQEADGNCRIIDFDEFASVVVPITDSAHFVRTSDDLVRVADDRLWLDRLVSPGAAAASMRRILRKDASRWNLALPQAAGCLLFYLADVAVGIYQRNAPERMWGRFRDELPRAAGLIRESGSLQVLGERLLSVD